MTNLNRFLAYAAAFENTYADDDWSRLEPFFADDAVYTVTGLPSSCEIRGRDNILRGIRRSVDGFDRRMDSRAIVASGMPVDPGHTVTLTGFVRYRRGASPPVELQATIVAELAGERIVRMHDHFTLDPTAIAWLQQNRDLDGAYV